ncbi:polyhydroxyalkanoic acid system family protein [Roseimaritima sediminicola]|uniref:polyhydroxyalkanoic acid system family protein n=1 Tax=Roseimaritima sediminicola TaxID=2662066 RepID=UPI0012983AD6|nr:polyhydroxyalkanoic acid system family protein [Roseimaritima sediminicola]
MPAFKTSVPHGLSADEAKQRVDALMQTIDKKYPGMVNNLTSQWNDNRLSLAFTVYGFDIKSDLVVEDQRVDIDGKIPLAALPFKGKVQETISTKLQELLA